jgi:putative DNA methylase
LVAKFNGFFFTWGVSICSPPKIRDGQEFFLPQGTLGFRVQLYGMEKWQYLFTNCQLLSLTTLVKLVKTLAENLNNEYDKGLSIAIQTCLALAMSRLSDFNSALCILNAAGGRGVVHTFRRQAIPMVWDFMETNPFNDVGANWNAGVQSLEETIKSESILKMRIKS